MIAPWTLWNLPFFDPAHEALAARLAAWQERQPPYVAEQPGADLGKECRRWARELADYGLLDYAVPTADADGRRAPEAARRRPSRSTAATRSESRPRETPDSKR